MAPNFARTWSPGSSAKRDRPRLPFDNSPRQDASIRRSSDPSSNGAALASAEPAVLLVATSRDVVLASGGPVSPATRASLALGPARVAKSFPAALDFKRLRCVKLPT